jgi:hypothetical protein
MIPAFETGGFLPKGIHWSTLAEIEVRYALNDHRRRLMGGLRNGLLALVAAGCRKVYVDGSFVTNKEFPGDYDICWEVTGVRASELDRVFLDFTNKRAAQKAKFLGEFFPAYAKAELKSPYRTFLEFFQSDKDTGDAKGIVGINFSMKTI